MQWSANPEDHNDTWRASYTLTPKELRESVFLFPQNPPRRRWEVAHAMNQPAQCDGNKPFCRGGGGERKKKACDCWQRMPTFSGRICPVYFFASYFNKGAQWVYQTALMKGLLARLPAADPLDPKCVFTINPPLCLQQATSSALPPPCCFNPLPSHTNGHSYRSKHPPPPTKPLLHHSTSPAHIRYSAHTLPAHCTCLHTVHNALNMHLRTCLHAHTEQPALAGPHR